MTFTPGEIAWADQPPRICSPQRCPWPDLSWPEAQALRTWFVAHVNVLPSPSPRRRPKTMADDPKVQQLSLLED
jgi:deoxyribodipyrimidine photo-lyase